jgi:ADP-dependent NAD(P)H-hydrate dehydratase / NAD(P)H-hydrate epimerase
VRRKTMKLVSVEEMRAIERAADAAGWTYAQMMNQAGAGLAEVVHSFYGYSDDLTVTGLVGPGNNGGDTLVALALLAESGWKTAAYLVRAREESDPLLRRFLQSGGESVSMDADAGFALLDVWLKESSVLLDGVLGTGIRLPLKPEVADLLEHVRLSPFLAPVVAVDCPSGIDCDSGEAAPECIAAEVTVCMAAVKEGLLKLPAFQLAGDLQVVGIGLPEDLAAWNEIKNEVVDEGRVREILRPRPSDGHKGTFGTVLIAAGSLNYTGAAWLAGTGAARIGAGLVTLAIPAPLHPALAGHFPEATWVLLPHQMGAVSGEAAAVLRRSLERVTALLVGPGFGLEDCTAEFVRRLLEETDQPARRGGLGFVAAAQAAASVSDQKRTQLPPMVVDADGLKLLARVNNWQEKLPATAVLTPHPGEMSVLTGLPVSEIQADRLALARKYARDWGHVVVLKGAFSIIAAPDGRIAVVPVASSALAHAGSGDVLAGMITGLRAQGIPAYEAALAGVWLHAQAGLAAAERLGHEASVLAGDVATSIAEVLSWVWDR